MLPVRGLRKGVEAPRLSLSTRRVRNSFAKAHFFPIKRQLWGDGRSPFRVLFSKVLKARQGIADKGCVSTLAHTMMTAARPADAGVTGPNELDRYPYPGVPASDRS